MAGINLMPVRSLHPVVAGGLGGGDGGGGGLQLNTYEWVGMAHTYMKLLLQASARQPSRLLAKLVPLS